MSAKEHAVITVTGRDRVGIVARVSGVLAGCNVNIVDISQTLLQDIFAMILMVDMSEANTSLIGLKEILAETGKEMGLNIVIQHEDIFRYMHRI